MYGGRSVRREKEVGGWVKEKQQEQGCSLKTGERCRGTEERKARAMPPFAQRQNSNPLLVPRDIIEPQSLSVHLGIHKKGKNAKMRIKRLGSDK
jgi:hypothetical protein